MNIPDYRRRNFLKGTAAAVLNMATLGLVVNSSCTPENKPAATGSHPDYPEEYYQKTFAIKSDQLAVVLTENWDAPWGYLYFLERKENNWTLLFGGIEVNVGAKGLGWGLGQKTWQKEDPGPVKREGDKKAPAGLFAIRPRLYGYADVAPQGVTLPYSKLTEDWVGVDDSKSRYYNQVIDKRMVEKIDWNSHEQMRRKDHLYKWVMVIEHNKQAMPQAGSCIFIHLQRGARKPTLGCTSMAEENFLRLAQSLSVEKQPVILQLPRGLYEKHRGLLDTPELK